MEQTYLDAFSDDGFWIWSGTIGGDERPEVQSQTCWRTSRQKGAGRSTVTLTWNWKEVQTAAWSVAQQTESSWSSESPWLIFSRPQGHPSSRFANLYQVCLIMILDLSFKLSSTPAFKAHSYHSLFIEVLLSGSATTGDKRLNIEQQDKAAAASSTTRLRAYPGTSTPHRSQAHLEIVSSISRSKIKVGTL